MKKTLFILFTWMATWVNAQTAKVQIIHNSADANAESVDVWLNGNKILDDFAFRNATPFLDVPAGVSLTIDICPNNSTSTSPSIYSVSGLTLNANENYVAIATGIIAGSTGYNPAPSFALNVFSPGRLTASQSGNVDVLVFHGCTDAPPVSIIERNIPAGIIYNNLAYNQFTNSYLELAALDYVLDIRATAALTNTVASYTAPLQTLGLAGNALVVVASGFLNPANNNNGADFGLYVAPPTGGAMIALPTVNASKGSSKIQLIHNSADLAANPVDIYINGDLNLDNFAFRTATPFIDLPSFVKLSVGIAPGNSTTVNDTIVNYDLMLDDDKNIIIVANGIVSSTGYSPVEPFDLYYYDNARLQASNSSNTDILVFHGATDAPTVDVRLMDNTVIVDDISYADITSSYLEVPTSNFDIKLTDASGSTTVQTYSVPLSTLNLQGQALTVLASGFLNPSNNSNGPAFGLWVALASGGALVQLPLAGSTSTQKLQNSSITVFPNPTNDVFYITSTEKLNAQAIITDIMGRVLIQTSLTDFVQFIDIHNLSNGIYSLQLIQGNETQSFKIVKQ